MISQPPIPPAIRDLLSPFPELLNELQDALGKALQAGAAPRFEAAIWAIKDTLGDMLSETLAEISRAEEDGGTAATESLVRKRSLIGKARSNTAGMGDLHDLRVYCDEADRRIL